MAYSAELLLKQYKETAIGNVSNKLELDKLTFLLQKNMSFCIK